MRKRYKLLKDLPDCDAGTVFEDDGEDSGYHYPDKYGRTGWVFGNVVEGNPDWFEKINKDLIVAFFQDYINSKK